MKILIVDDVQYCLLFLERTLESLGHHVIKSETVFDAIKKLETHDDVDMVITDYALDEHDGLALMKACKKRYAQTSPEKVPSFIMLSAHLSSQLEKQAKLEGFLDVLAKPCSRTSIEASLSKLPS